MRSIRYQDISSLPLGISLGVVLSSHSIRSVIHIDFHKVAMATFLCLMVFYLMRKLKYLSQMKLNITNSLVLTFVLSAIIYFLFTTIINKNYVKFIELVSIMLPLSLGWILRGKKNVLFIAIFIVLVSCMVQSVTILHDRMHVIGWKLNYLLVASLLPVAILYCFTEIWFSENLRNKLFFICATILMLMGIAQMQARFSAIFALAGIIVITVLNYKKILKTWTGAFLLILTIFSIPYILFAIQRASFYVRMLDIDLNKIDRIEIFSSYLNLMKPYWLTGYGIGETPEIPIHFYPHNYLLEFYTEFGVLGLTFSVLITLLALKNVFYNFSNDKIARFTLILLIHYILFFLKSATIYDAYILFTSLGIAMSLRSPLGPTDLKSRNGSNLN